MDNLTTAVHELLQFQICIKIYHWQTHSYARHIASDDLHGRISKNIDLIVESLQGELKTRIKFIDTCVLNLHNMNDKNIVNLLITTREWLESKFVKMFASSKFLVNIKDEIVTDINQILYLFTLS